MWGATWKTSATLIGVTVNSLTASGGTLTGPPLAPLILAGMMGAGAPTHIAPAFAIGTDQVWQRWAQSVKVPGLPWYPAFAAMPSPFAPPMPNVPTPLSALAGARITADSVRASILASFGKFAEPGKTEAVIDFAAWLAATFEMMLGSTMVVNVLGSGPVPTFAPPYVPVGPVVGGVANGIPPTFIGGGAAPRPR